MKKIIFIFLLSVLLVTPCIIFQESEKISAAGWLSNWSYRKKITVSNTNVGQTLADFPLLVKITSDSNIGANSLSTGNDIRFTASDGVTLLSYEKESWTGGGGSAATANFWVKVPSISNTSATDIYIYYGNASAPDGQNATSVWDSNFKAVLHLNETGSGVAGEYKDSTTTGNNGQGGGGTASRTPSRVAGKLGYGQNFSGNGADDYISLGNNVSINSSLNTFTVSAWVKTSATGMIPLIGWSTTTDWPGLYTTLSNTPIVYMGQSSYQYYNNSPSNAHNGSWHWVSFTVPGTGQTDVNSSAVFIDGQSQAKGSGTDPASQAAKVSATLGMSSGWYTFNGAIDEFRISNTVRSSAWTKFEYYNMNSANNELAFAAEENSGTPPPATYTLITTATNGTVTKNPNQTTYNSETTVTLTATPNTGYQFTSWSGDLTGSTNPATITMNSNKTVTANFTATTQTTYTITVTQGANGTISPGTTTVNSGASQTFTITSNSGYQISSVLVDGVSAGAVSAYTFSNVTSNHTISASFTTLPQGGRIRIANFDGSALPTDGDGNTYPNQYTGEGGAATVTQDSSVAIAGKSIKFNMTQGDLYAQFLPYNYVGLKTGVTSPRGFAREYSLDAAQWQFNTYNRMSFWIKVPANGPALNTDGTLNFQFGTYTKQVTPPTGSSQLYNWQNSDEYNTIRVWPQGSHFYHYLDIAPTGTWTKVILNMHPDHSRGVSGDPGVLNYPTGEDGLSGHPGPYNYFDALTEFYMNQAWAPSQNFPATFNLDEFEFYQESNQENDDQVHGIAATYVPGTNRVVLTWQRKAFQDSVNHEVRYAFSDIHQLGWTNATSAPSGTIAPMGGGDYSTMIYDNSTLPLSGHNTLYLAIKPQNSSIFSQISIPISSGTTATYTITASAGAGGTISPSGATAVNSGASQTFTITPNSGYQVSGVLVDGASQGATTTYTFSNVTATHTISASFSQISSGCSSVLTASCKTAAATSEEAAGTFPAQWTWDPAKTTNQPLPATSGIPTIKQYRNGQLIATYSTLGAGGPFDRSINNGIYAPWADGDIFEVYPAVYSGVNNQPWIGPKAGSEAEYSAGITHTPTNITIRGVTVNGFRPVILNSAGASDNTYNQSVVFVENSVNITIENIDIDGAGNNVGKAGIYLEGANSVTFRDMRIHGFRASDGNGIFGGIGANSGTIRLDGILLYDNGGSGGPEHNLYINNSATDPNFTVHMTNSWSYDAFYGHTFKSRAQVNILEGNYFQGGLPQSGETQADTYLVDIPNGGLLTMRNNILVKNRSGVNSNGASVSYASEGLEDARPLGITVENNTFVGFTKYYDGSHEIYPFEFFYPHQLPGSVGFPTNSIQRNVFVGYRTANDPVLDYRGTLALTAGFADINQDFSLKTNYTTVNTSIIGTPAYSHAAQRGSTRQLATIGAMDFGGSAPPDTTYTITASAGAGGSISPSGATTVNSGASQIFTIAPNSGYQIASVAVDGVSQGAIATYTFTNVTAAHTISASFTATDTTPPSRSSGTASNITTTSATLSLTTNENATCKYSTTANTAYGSMPNTFTATGTTSHSTNITGLTPATTYTYYVRCQDTAGNPNTTDYGILFQTASPPDTTPPSAVSNLSASSISQTSLTLSWTSPGDDNNSGTASNYDIRYLTSNITTSNWSSAIQLTGEPAPSAAGTTQSYTAVGLTANTTYYFAIKTSDEVPNTSAISNIATATTTSNTCSSFTYSSWSSCQPDNTQSRTVLTSSPSGCSGGNPVLTQSCVYTPPACTSFTYSAWGTCQPDNTQTRAITSSSPSGCTGGNPILAQSCAYVPPPPPFCTSFTYSAWSVCQSNNTQSRTIISSSPAGCNGGNPVLIQSCAYTPPTCTSFTYSSWSSCQPNNTQSRTVATQSPSGCSGGSPTLTQSCSYTPSDGGGGGGGGAPVEDNIPPSTPSSFTGTLSGNYITLTWNNPTDPDFVRVVVVRKENSASTSRTDGTAVYEGNLKEFKDTAISTNKTYYYSIYSYDTKPNYSLPAVISVSSKGTIEISTGGTGAVNPTDDTAKQIAELLAKIAQLKALIAQLLGKSFIPATFQFNNNLRYGQNSDEVKYLQLFLNQDPATKIADTGLGSPGQETIHFGRATLSAVFRFQDKYQSDIWPSPSLQKTKPGRGLVGPSTRAKINQLNGK